MALLLSPGQGSQSPGMLTPWLDLPGARATVERWSERTGLDLVELGTTETIFTNPQDSRTEDYVSGKFG